MNCSMDFYYADVRDAQSYIGLHAHSGYELVYYRTGRGKTRIDKTEYEYRPGTFAIIQPGVKHDEFRETDTDVRFFVFFYDNQPVRLANGLYEDRSGGRLPALLDRLASELRGQAPYYDFLIRSILIEFLVEVGRMVSPKDVAASEPGGKLLYAKSFIEQYCGESLDLPGLARTLGYSYDYFRHRFKEKIGYSPMQYAVRKRLDRAKAELLETDKSVTDISMSCGFSNTPQFCMMFKKHARMSPGEYRKRNQPTRAGGAED